MRLSTKFNRKMDAILSRVLVVMIVAILQACSSSGSSTDTTLDAETALGSDTATGTSTATESDTTTDTGDILIDEDVAVTASTLLDSSTISVPGNLPAAGNAVLFDYTMEAVTGGTTTARAQLFEPAVAPPEGGYPLVVWARGTTGIANSCAPSLSFEDFSNEVPINALLASGYAVLAPDYEGFGTPAVHPYLLRASHANSVLAAIPAAHEIEGSQLSEEWALVGHSQGGHVVLATARAEQNPDFPLPAAVALAPATDLQALSDRAFEEVDQALAEGDFNGAAERVFFLNVNGALVAQSFSSVNSELVPQNLFGDTVAELIDIALDEEFCGTFFDAVNDALVEHVTGGGTLDSFAGLRRDWHTEPALMDQLIQESFNDEVQAAPLLVVQGDADRQIPVAATTAFVDTQTSVGTDVTFLLIPGGRHFDVAGDDFGLALDWLVQRFAP